MDSQDLPRHRAELRRLLDEKDMRSVLMYLNGLTPHRFTALYQFSESMLKQSFFYDQENPRADVSEDIPIEASYCVFLKNTGRKFVTADSLTDSRVAKHQKRQEIRSYCGVPLVTMSGQMFGSVCHFDLDAVPIDAAMVELMEDIAQMIMEHPHLVMSKREK